MRGRVRVRVRGRGRGRVRVRVWVRVWVWARVRVRVRLRCERSLQRAARSAAAAIGRVRGGWWHNRVTSTLRCAQRR